jgi:excisionase family DNA binding protein
VNVRQAATRLEVSQATVYALVAAGKLKCYRVGLGRGCIRISEEHIADYLEKAEAKVTVPSAHASPSLPQLRNLRLR